MRILPICPIDREFMEPSVFPLGAAYVAASLQREGHSVRILDLNVARDEGDRLLRELLETETFDWIGISSTVAWKAGALNRQGPNLEGREHI